MKLWIAETGYPPGELGGAWPSYPSMFARMLEEAGGAFEVTSVDVAAGETLPPPEEGSALLVTGSPAGAYEDRAFIPVLEESVRRFAHAGRPVVGICFGHQLVARAFGAKVAKSSRGWGVGVHSYEVLSETPWRGGPARFACAVSHQDQVETLPEGFRVVAGSPFCPMGCLAHDSLRVLTFQPHPEFSHAYARALLRLRSDRIPPDRIAYGEATLRHDSDRGLIGTWISDFLAG
jgi:GMP synthase-like glutamine amidotransferase